MKTRSKLLIGLLAILFILSAENLALSQETKSVQKEQQVVKANPLTHDQIISETQRGVDRSLTIMDHTISAIGVLVGLLTLIVVVLGGIFGFFGFKTFSSLRKDIETIKDIAGKSETKYKEAEVTLNKIKPIADKIARYEKDIKEYENESRNLPITEKPSEERKLKLDDIAKKSEFLEGVGVEPEAEDFINRGLDHFYKQEYEKAKVAFERAVKLDPNNADIWFNIGVALGKLGKTEDALKSYDKTIELERDYGNAWYNKACAYSLKGDKERSLESLGRAIALDQKYKVMSKKDEDFKGLWSDEEFKKIVE